ncbi:MULTISPECIES: hypothetical protein [unclassified Leifsonia]|uniref:hypothetical protein n=1 Tax=unclassified Leifsonia TaxID=2663824 RepID=UPI0006F7954F|nr:MULTISPECIES: hypothetical protein [unclassified Leifsonia]KQX05084.1 hypothetical protein ASC59_12735 [Leifsonia sp. Root1293]KRA08716.1 hypothetical protein ASD61_12735 [Leifsonia sp. Root60]
MPHDYALHTALQARCLCCGSLQPFTFSSPSDQVVCAHCRSHLGPEKAERRDLAHIALWRGISEAQALAAADAAEQAETDAAAASARISELEAKVTELSATVIGQFDSAPASGIREELQSDLVRRAERATELANRRTDRMMAVLWRAATLHHVAAGAAACSCGKPAATCPELRILNSEQQALRDWEAKNVALAASGARHALPPEHPAVPDAAGTAGGATAYSSRRKQRN